MNDLEWGIQLWDFKDVKTLIDEFLDLYHQRPIYNNKGGMMSTHLFWTWYVVKKVKPKYIIESGVYKGQGTWILSKACPNAKIYSIDPNLAQRIYIDENVTYYSKDFNLIDWSGVDPQETFCFFDDHQNAYARLQQMKWMGFKKAMFEDNYPINQGDCYSCKKILSECGLSVNGKVKIEANKAHARYFCNNIKTYTTLPPLFQNENTRWGDKWDNINYPTPVPLFSNEDIDAYPILKDEADGYTWICYVELK